MRIGIKTAVAIALALTAAAAVAQDGEWEPIRGTDTLKEFMSGLTAERKLPGGGISRAEYSADGTGVLRSWGEKFPRTWRVEGETHVCITQETSKTPPRASSSSAAPATRRSTGCARSTPAS